MQVVYGMLHEIMHALRSADEQRLSLTCGCMLTDRRLDVFPGHVLFSLIFRVPPAGFEPATHGLGNRCSIP